MKNVFMTKCCLALVAALIISLNHEHVSAASGYINSCPIDLDDESCENSWISGEVLILRTCENGFGSAYRTTEIATGIIDGTLLNDIYKKDKEIDFDWETGFRLGLGYDFECSRWNTALFWTNFKECSKGRECDNYAHWKLNLNQVDGLLAYQLEYGTCFSLKPFFGARYAEIYQKLSTYLKTEITDVLTAASILEISKKHDHEHFWGAGPLFGFEANFIVGCGLSAYGNLAGSFLYGKFKNKFHEHDAFTGFLSNRRTVKDNCQVLMGFDAALGFRYEVSCVTVQIGLEHHTYFDYNQIGRRGNLNLYGANLSGIVRF